MSLQVNYPARIPVENITSTPTKNPYAVTNPYPNLNQGTPYNSYNQDLMAMNSMNHWNGQPNMSVNQFNPNSFYNQHSQYKGGDMTSMSAQKMNTNVTPIKNQRENLATFSNYNNAGFTPNAASTKQNFDQSSNKPKRHAAYDTLENQAGPQLIPNTRYLSYNNPQQGALPGYHTGNFNYRPPIFANTYNAPPRESHSNPPPYSQFEAFGHPATQGRGQPGHSVNEFNDNSDILSVKGGQGGQKFQLGSKTTYKPYSLKDYKDIKSRAAVQLGGLGPNTNTSEWQKEKEKRNKMAEFSQNVKLFNSRRFIGGTETSFNKQREEKEKSRRDVALEFARNIPKPVRVKRFNDDEEIEELVGYKNQNSSPEGRIYKAAAFDELAAFERQHNQYRMQIESLKN